MIEEKNNKVVMVLLIVGVVFMLIAGCLGYYIWLQGKVAETSAQAMLESQAQEDIVVSTLQISSLNMELPVVWEYSEESLETTICRYQGPNPGHSGNLVITGHDYLSGAHFGTLHKIAEGDAVLLYDRHGALHQYTVYRLEEVLPDDVLALQDYGGEHELTLLTCKDNANKRLLVRCSYDGTGGESPDQSKSIPDNEE